MNTKLLISVTLLSWSILKFAAHALQSSNEEQLNKSLSNDVEERHQNYSVFNPFELKMERMVTMSSSVLRTSPMHSQQVKLITVDQLNERLEQGRDTTFIVNFWATWCAPCIKELPHFEKLQQEKRREKLKVLLVSVDFKSRLEKSVVPFAKNRGLKNEVFLLDETDPQIYIDRIDKTWSGAIPATLFVKGKKRRLIEKEFTYPSLLAEYQNLK